MTKIVFNIFLLLLISISAFPQEFNYVHYDTKDGLAGSTVYDICQDKDDFIWFATENGLSRFDGTNFKTFTVKDGLPDNEVLKLFTDSKGRVWIGTFSKDICYYYKGKIYNKVNDSLVNKIFLTGSLSAIAEENDGTIAFSDSKVIAIIPPENLKKRIAHITIPGDFISLNNEFCGDSKIYAVNGKFEFYVLNDSKDAFYYKFKMPTEYSTAKTKFPWFVSSGNCNGVFIKRLPLKKGIIKNISLKRRFVIFCNN